MMSESGVTGAWDECGPNGQGQDMQPHPHWDKNGVGEVQQAAEFRTLQEVLWRAPMHTLPCQAHRASAMEGDDLQH